MTTDNGRAEPPRFPTPDSRLSRGGLADCRVVLGISGSIACYKAVDIASKLTQAGALVDTVMTPAATTFVTPLALRSVTGRRVYVEMFDPETDVAEAHVALARRADAVLVAPASATTIARIAHGLAEEMVSLTVLATKAPVLIAPAMDNQMWTNPATVANVETLRARGIAFVGPGIGRLASGHSGPGRLEEPPVVLGALRALLGRDGDLAGRRIVVSAGGTQEPLDPVRFISNHSSGKMGYAIAEAARDRGAAVTLIATPGTAALETPYGVTRVPVTRTVEMRDAVLAACRHADVLIMAAAPADFQPTNSADHKIKKQADGGLTLELEQTPDILQSVFQAELPVIRVGFAAETRDLLAYAREKITRKGLDLIVANDVSATDAGFGVDTNRVTLIDRDGTADEWPLMSKSEVAHRILDRILETLATGAPAAVQ
ncbi:MAG: bifunctional phosphopantothenoylcysteine decarboxylase/phosphopantothenate--cysteine ligase CoaBC [Dehalococcoidia bacterium]